MSESLDEFLVKEGINREKQLPHLKVSIDGQTLRLGGTVPKELSSHLNMALKPFRQKHRIKHFINQVRYLSREVAENGVKEQEESQASLFRKVKFVADLIREADDRGDFVVYTGAGVSTAAKIPDFRGPEGVWTRKDKGLPPPASVTLEQAVPTYTHRALVQLVEDGLVDYITSQNVDGLHRRSGIPADKMSELHGNCFREACANCEAEYLRSYNVCRRQGPHFANVRDTRSQSGISHITGRKCDKCNGMLRDTVIHFSENLPVDHLTRAETFANRAYVALCMGTSLHVTPAADLPELCTNAGGFMIIVNLQPTGRDVEALQTGGILIRAKCDSFMSALMAELGYRMQNTKDEEMKALEADVKARQVETEQMSRRKSEAMVPSVRPSFFSDLGLPPTLAQLPPYLSIEQQEFKANHFRFVISTPKGYPLKASELVKKVTYRFQNYEYTVEDTMHMLLSEEHVNDGSRVVGLIHFEEGFGEASEFPLRFEFTPKRGEEMASVQCRVPQLKMAPGIINNITARPNLRPVVTRVRRHDGSTYEVDIHREAQSVH